MVGSSGIPLGIAGRLFFLLLGVCIFVCKNLGTIVIFLFWEEENNLKTNIEILNCEK